jgi:hypothetical protein
MLIHPQMAKEVQLAVFLLEQKTDGYRTVKTDSSTSGDVISIR